MGAGREITFRSVRDALRFKGDHFGLLMGMCKTAVSRIEKGRRKETLTQKEALSMVMFLQEKGLVEEYVEWRFGLKVTKSFYQK